MEKDKVLELLENARTDKSMSQKRIQDLIEFNQRIIQIVKFSDDPSVVRQYTELDNCIGKTIKFEGKFQDISSIEN